MLVVLIILALLGAALVYFGRREAGDRFVVYFGYACLLGALILLVLLLVPDANAQVPGPGDPAPQPDGPVLTGFPLYLMALEAVVPLFGYLLNHFAPWASEQAKGIGQAMLAAGVAVLYQAATPSDLGFNEQTLVAVIVGMGTALFAHVGWRASAINVALGGGTNSDGSASTVKPGLSGRRR